MEVFTVQDVYFKTDTSGPAEIVCCADGRIDFSELAQEFRLDPTSIRLNGTRFPKTELKSETTWEQIEKYFKRMGRPVGTEDDPVIVTGIVPIL